CVRWHHGSFDIW
nr:immunoglobulin heavy chain junction region [Macaca mulatta]